MQRLGIKPIGEGDYLICLDRDSAKAVHVAFNIILEVAIGDRTQKWHSSIHCLNIRLSRAKPIGAGQTVLGVMSAWGQSRLADTPPAVAACPLRAESGQVGRRFAKSALCHRADVPGLPRFCPLLGKEPIFSTHLRA